MNEDERPPMFEAQGEVSLVPVSSPLYSYSSVDKGQSQKQIVRSMTTPPQFGDGSQFVTSITISSNPIQRTGTLIRSEFETQFQHNVSFRQAGGAVLTSDVGGQHVLPTPIQAPSPLPPPVVMSQPIMMQQPNLSPSFPYPVSDTHQQPTSNIPVAAVGVSSLPVTQQISPPSVLPVVSPLKPSISTSVSIASSPPLHANNQPLKVGQYSNMIYGQPNLRSQLNSAPMNPAFEGYSLYGKWSESLFNCCSQPSLCCLSILVPALLFGRSIRHSGLGKFTSHFFMYMIPWLIAVICYVYFAFSRKSWEFIFCVIANFILTMLGCIFRGRIRDKYQIDGDSIEDCCVHMCCTCCALSQEAKHVEKGYLLQQYQLKQQQEQHALQQQQQQFYAVTGHSAQSV